MLRLRVLLVLVGLLAATYAPGARLHAEPVQKKARHAASDAFFAAGQIPYIDLFIAEPELEQLRLQPREYVKGTLIEFLDGAKVFYNDVGVKLKGAAGSFRRVDDRPALTINFNKFNKGQTFHGLDKLHLNNSVQDRTYLHELLAGEVCAVAGVPAARASHARVWLNGRDLGLYGLKEGIERTFLARHFEDPSGNLYDAGFCNDIDAKLQKDSGDGPDDQSDLKTLLAACRNSNDAERWQLLEASLDIDQFLKFAAVELMLGHWDGYCDNRNNYRIYFDPRTGKAHFIPHGMDQVLRNPGANILHTPRGIVCAAVFSNPLWRAQYRRYVDELLPAFTSTDDLFARIDTAQERIRPTVAAIQPTAAGEFDAQLRDLKNRLTARGQNLLLQNSQPDPRPLQFDSDGIARLPKWNKRLDPADSQEDEVDVDGVRALLIAVGPSGKCNASWRTRLLLPAGRYELQARIRTEEVVAAAPTPDSGAGLRVSGGLRTNTAQGSSDWQQVKVPLEVPFYPQEIELVAELRATAGRVWFDVESLQLEKVSQ